MNHLSYVDSLEYQTLTKTVRRFSLGYQANLSTMGVAERSEVGAPGVDFTPGFSAFLIFALFCVPPFVPRHSCRPKLPSPNLPAQKYNRRQHPTPVCSPDDRVGQVGSVRARWNHAGDRKFHSELNAMSATYHNSLKRMAGPTGLEPATSCVTGRRSNQLNYGPALRINDIAKSLCLSSFAPFAYTASCAPDALESGYFRRNRP